MVAKTEVPPNSDGAEYSEADGKWYVMNAHMSSQLGFLFAAYEPVLWWWEVLVRAHPGLLLPVCRSR